MNLHRIKTTLTKDGKLTLENLPYQQGDRVEIIIVDSSSSKTVNNPYPLRGTVIHYDNPLEPVAMPED